MRSIVSSLLLSVLGSALVTLGSFLYKKFRLSSSLPSSRESYSEKTILTVNLTFGICFAIVVMTLFALVIRYVENQLLLAILVVFGFFASVFSLSAFSYLLEAIKALKDELNEQHRKNSAEDRPQDFEHVS